jgi:outer membrane protein TolC
LNATTGRENLEINLVQAKANLLQDRIQLYRALGGDWNFLLKE